jgi:hypothetical protein
MQWRRYNTVMQCGRDTASREPRGLRWPRWREQRWWAAEGGSGSSLAGSTLVDLVAVRGWRWQPWAAHRPSLAVAGRGSWLIAFPVVSACCSAAQPVHGGALVCRRCPWQWVVWRARVAGVACTCGRCGGALARRWWWWWCSERRHLPDWCEVRRWPGEVRGSQREGRGGGRAVAVSGQRGKAMAAKWRLVSMTQSDRMRRRLRCEAVSLEALCPCKWCS